MQLYVISEGAADQVCVTKKLNILFLQNATYDYDVLHTEVFSYDLNTTKQLKILCSVHNIHCCPSLA